MKLKEYLTQPPLLSPKVIGEKLQLYLAISNTPMSWALIREKLHIEIGILHQPRILGS